MRRSVLFALAIVCCLSSACGSTSTSSTTSLESKSPAAILALAQKAINDAHWSFRFQDETRVGNSATTITGDESATTAVQSLSGSLPTLEITRTADGDIYLHGNANALVSALGLSQAAAAANAGHWIALTPGDAPYAKVAGTLEPQDEVDPYLPQAHLRMVAAVHPSMDTAS